MAILDGFVAFALASFDITRLISDRLQPGPNLDQAPTYPHTEYFLTSGNNDYTFDGVEAVLRTARIQCNHIGKFADVVSVGQAFDGAFEGYVGLLPDGTRVLFVESAGGLTTATGVIDPAIGAVQKFSQDFIFQYADSELQDPNL